MRIPPRRRYPRIRLRTPPRITDRTSPASGTRIGIRFAGRFLAGFARGFLRATMVTVTVLGVDDVEFVGGEFAGGQPVQERRRRQHVAIGGDP